MRLSGRAVWLAGAVAVSVVARSALAQEGIVRAPPQAQVGVSGADQAGTLDVPPRFGSSPPAAPAPAMVPPPASNSSAGAPDSPENAPANDADAASPAAPEDKLPYLGIGVQYIVSDDTRGREVRGLEVVDVDPASPAEQAGLHGRGQMTNLGASGATAGALMAPLDLIITPLLKKAGDLGQDGDLIVAIDDNRIEGENDLRDALASLKPGDLIYLTLVRQHKDGTHETLKLPVRLAPPRLSARDQRDLPVLA
jgi:hypothetical protein